MKVNIVQHCDEAMQDGNVVAFVTAVFRAVEGKERAYHLKSRRSTGEVCVELSVGANLLLCKAFLKDDLGTLAEFDAGKEKFYPLDNNQPLNGRSAYKLI